MLWAVLWAALGAVLCALLHCWVHHSLHRAADWWHAALRLLCPCVPVSLCPCVPVSLCPCVPVSLCPCAPVRQLCLHLAALPMYHPQPQLILPCPRPLPHRNDCISPWLGKRAPHHFVQAYQLRIEEPFNATDNTARAVGSNITGGRGNGGSVQSIARKLKQAAAITRATTEARAAAAAALVLFSPEGCSKLAPTLLVALQLREVLEQRLPGWAVSELDRGLLRWGGGQEERDMLQDAQRQAGLLRKAAAAAGQQQQRAATAAAVALPTEVEAMLSNLSIGSMQERGRQQQGQERGQEPPAQDAVAAATAAVHNLLSGTAPSASRQAAGPAASAAAGPSSHPLHSDATSPGTQLWQSKRASARKAAAEEAQAIAQALLAHWPAEQSLSADAIEAMVGQLQHRHIKPMTSQRVHAMLLLHQVLQLRAGTPLDIKITPKAGRQAAGEAGQAQAGAEDSAGPRKVPVDLANFLQVTQEWDRAEMEGILGFLRKKAGGGGGKEQQQQKDAQQDKAAAAAAAIAAAAATAAAKAAARPAAPAPAAGPAAGSAPSSPLQRAALQHAARVQQELDEAAARAEVAHAAQQRFEELLAQHGGVQHFMESERIDAAVRRSGLGKAARARLQALLHLARLEAVKGSDHVIYKVQDAGSSRIVSVKRLSSSSSLSKICEDWSLKQLQELQRWLESEAARLLQGASANAGSGSSSADSSAAAAAVAANAMATAAVASLPAAQHAGSSGGENGRLDGVRSRSDACAAAQLAAHDVLMEQAADAPPLDVRQVTAMVQAARLPSTHSCQQRMACLLLLAEVQRQAGLADVPYVMRHNGKEQRLVLSHDRLSADMAKWGMNQVKVLQAWLQQRLEQCAGGASSSGSAGSDQQLLSDGSGTSSTQDAAAAVAAVPSSSTDTTNATAATTISSQHTDKASPDAAPPSDSKSHSRALLQAQARVQQLEASEQPLLMELLYPRGRGGAGGLPLKDVGPQLEGWSTSQLKEFRDWADELLRQPVLQQQAQQQQEGLRAAAPSAEAVPG